MLRILQVPRSYCEAGLRFERRDSGLLPYMHRVTEMDAENGMFWVWNCSMGVRPILMRYMYNGKVDLNSVRAIIRRQNQ